MSIATFLIQFDLIFTSINSILKRLKFKSVTSGEKEIETETN